MMNIGSGGKVSGGYKRTSQSRRMKTAKSIDTSMAMTGFKDQKFYKVGRTMQSGLKHMFEDSNYVDSCYDYDIIIGFAELDEAYCKGANPPKRIFSVNANVGGGPPIDIVKDLNVVAATGGSCYKAFTVKQTVTPKTKNIDIQFKKATGNASDGEPIVSFIAIQRHETRRLDSKCNQDVV